MEQAEEFAVVYITGRGHSGSTVLDIILDNHESIQGVGELTSGFGFRNKVEECACQVPLDTCDFWGNIRRELQQLHPETDFDEYSGMMNYMARFYRIPQILIKLGLPAWLSEYDSMTYDLYSLISHQSGRPYIVDSSKEMAYAYYLLTRFPGEARVIHLVRDGRGVMWSRLRRLRAGRPFQFLRRYLAPKRHWAFMILSVLSWDFGNIAGELLRLVNKNQVIQVRYEDLCENPSQVLTRIGEFLGLDMTKLVGQIEKEQPFRIGHTIAGNSMRHTPSGTFTFKPDYAWRRHLPKRYKMLFLLLAFPLVAFYGYLHEN